MKKYRAIVLIIAAICLIPCAGFSKTFPIGAFFPMTGSGAHIGRAMSQGALTAIEQLNKEGGVQGYTFDFIITDFKNVDVNLAVTGVRKMISVDKIPAVLAATALPPWALNPFVKKQRC